MTDTSSTHVGLGTYWKTWGVLLALTLVMLVVDGSDVSRALLVGVILLAMVIKATLIAGYFMHLRYEHVAIGITVIVCLFLVGAFLYALILPDAYRIAGMGQP